MVKAVSRLLIVAYWANACATVPSWARTTVRKSPVRAVQFMISI